MSVQPEPEVHSDGLYRLQPRHRRLALAHLRERVAHNAYLLAQIARGALARDDVAGPLVGFWRGGQLDGLCIFGSNLVVSAASSSQAVEAFAEYARRSRFRVWVAVGEDAVIAHFMDAFGRRRRRIHVERGHQHLYQLRPDALPEDARLDSLRPADVSELEVMMRADRAMVTEELGFDPFVRDVEAYRSGWIRRLRDQRTAVLRDGDAPLRFKVDQSAASDDVVQLAGIYTRPEDRRRGLAYLGVGEACARLFGVGVPLISLYVHRFNRPAIGLYLRLGFEVAGEVRSVWFEA